MKENSIAVSVSLLFHIVIVALFLRVPLDQYIKPKLMVLDFSLEKGRTANGVEDGNRETQIANRKSQIANRTAENEGSIINREQNIQRKFAAEPSSELNTVASDSAGQVMIRGETGPMGAKADSVSGKNIFVGEGLGNLPAVSGSLRVIDYGKGGFGEKDFPFIAETLNRRFKNRYPDRARRMGWEGEVLVSFIISENGIIRDLQIVKGAAHHIFDDDAMKGLIGTTFGEKLPYPLKIENRRIIYKLQ
jgi:TonB family protein